MSSSMPIVRGRVIDTQTAQHLKIHHGASLAKALDEAHEASVICMAEFPHAVVHVNRAWSELTQYELGDIEGRDLSVLHGPSTNMSKINEMMENMASKGYATATVVTYKKYGEAFLCEITAKPVVTTDNYGDYTITHFVVVMKKTSGDSNDKINTVFLPRRKEMEQHSSSTNFTDMETSDDSSSEELSKKIFAISGLATDNTDPTPTDNNSDCSPLQLSGSDNYSDNNGSNNSHNNNNNNNGYYLRSLYTDSNGDNFNASNNGNNSSNGNSNNYRSSANSTNNDTGSDSGYMSNNSSNNSSRQDFDENNRNNNSNRYTDRQ